MEGSMFSYFTVVYGLKQNQRFNEAREISDLLLRFNCMIHQHNTQNGKSCGYPGVHFHGIFEYITTLDYRKEPIFKQLKMCCSYFKDEDFNPLDYFLLVKKYDMDLVCTRICDATYLQKHRENYEALQRENTSLVAIDKITNHCHFNLPKIPLNSILDLCKAFSLNCSSKKSYLTPSDSTIYVQSWCLAQNIDLGEFVNNWIYCLNSESQYKNALFFQGINNSCPKAILNSIIDACQPFVGKVSNETTGYKFFWKYCLGKRMIALYEPHFDRLHSTDKMLEILEGTESTIPVDDNNTTVAMQRTPVVIIAQEYPGDRKLQFEIKNRLVKGYNKLKSFQPPPKRLHPMWLCDMAKKYYVPWRERNTSMRPPSPSDNISNKMTVQPGTLAGANIKNTTVQPGTSAGANIKNTTIEPGTSAGANIKNTTVQPETLAGANIIEFATFQPGTSAGANIIENTTVQPDKSTEAPLQDWLLSEYKRITLESQKESKNASDWSCSELSEYNSESDSMDTEENTEEAPVNLELKLSNDANKHRLNARESKAQNEENDLSIPVIKPLGPSNINKNKRKSEGGHQALQDQCKKMKKDPNKPSPNVGLFIKVRPQDNNSSGSSNTKISKEKQTKGVPCKHKISPGHFITSDLGALVLNPSKSESKGGNRDQCKKKKKDCKKPFPNLNTFMKKVLPKVNNSPCPSNTKIRNGKRTKGKIKADKHCQVNTKSASGSTHQAHESHQVSITPNIGQTAGREIPCRSQQEIASLQVSVTPNFGKTEAREIAGQDLARSQVFWEITRQSQQEVASPQVSITQVMGQTSARAHQAQQRGAGPSITPVAHAPGPSTKSGIHGERKRSKAAREKVMNSWNRSPQPPENKPKCTYKNLLGINSQK